MWTNTIQNGELQDRKRVSPFRQFRERVHVRENDHLLLVRDVSLHETLINLVRQQTLDFFHRQLHSRDGQCRMEDPDGHPIPLRRCYPPERDSRHSYKIRRCVSGVLTRVGTHPVDTAPETSRGLEEH